MALTRREALARSALAGSTFGLGGCTALTGSDPAVLVEHTVSGSARVGFVGDLVLARGVEATHATDPAGTWDGLRDRLNALDGVVGNLECTLTTRGEAWPAKTFHFRADPDYATAALSAGNVAGVALANNHAMDFGGVSVRDTIDHLDDAGIAHAGAGDDRTAAFAPATFAAGEVTVAMIGLTDRFEPFAAGQASNGTAYLNLKLTDPGTRRTINRALSRIPGGVDLVVASLHWGPNYRPKTDDHRRFARWLIQRGVDVVHGHSAHEIHGVEAFQGGVVCYDTGNFVADFAPVEGHYNDRGFLFELVVDDGLDSLVLHPVEIVDRTVRPARSAARTWLEHWIRERSARYDTGIVAASGGDRLRVPLGQG